MEIKILKATNRIGVNPKRLKLPPQADDPKIRLESPGTVIGNVGFFHQLVECSKRNLGQPEPTMVEVLVQEIDGQFYFTFAPAIETSENVYALKFNSETRSPDVRGLKALLAEARIMLNENTVYEMDTSLAQDGEEHYFVAGNWTTAEAVLGSDRASQTAAALQPSGQ